MKNSNFQKLIQVSVNHLGKSDCADRFDVSVPAIERWLSGESTPRKVVKNFVFDVLNDIRIELIKKKNREKIGCEDSEFLIDLQDVIDEVVESEHPVPEPPD